MENLQNLWRVSWKSEYVDSKKPTGHGSWSVDKRPITDLVESSNKRYVNIRHYVEQFDVCSVEHQKSLDEQMKVKKED